MNKIILVRGLPGSGKTTFANKFDSAGVREADTFFGPEYKFDAKFISYAHQMCLAQAAQDIMFGGYSVVANTFTTTWEFENYIKLAEISNSKLEIFECTGNYGSVHNVPEAALIKMRARWVGSEILIPWIGVNYPLVKFSYFEVNDATIEKIDI